MLMILVVMVSAVLLYLSRYARCKVNVIYLFHMTFRQENTIFTFLPFVSSTTSSRLAAGDTFGSSLDPSNLFEINLDKL